MTAEVVRLNAERYRRRRDRRVRVVRRAVARGLYRVPSQEVADAILRSWGAASFNGGRERTEDGPEVERSASAGVSVGLEWGGRVSGCGASDEGQTRGGGDAA